MILSALNKDAWNDQLLSVLFGVVFHIMTIQQTGAVTGADPLCLVFHFPVGIVLDNILIEPDEVLILGAAMGVMAGET